jgi:MFS transporter, YNFM family, putative membrane transport protein
MTPHQRPKAGSEEAPVVAPLAVLVTCALLVLSALLSYSAGTRHRRTVRGRRDRGRSSCWHHVRAGLWLRISDLRAAVGPLWTQAGAGARDGRTVTRDSWLGGRILTAHGGSAANNSGFCGGELFRSSAGVRWRSPSAEMAVHGDRRDVNRLLSAGILGQVYAQAVVETLGWRWVFGVAAPALLIAAIAVATILIEPTHSRPRASLTQKYREVARLAVRRDLLLPNAASFSVLLSFVGMYAALGPLLQTQFGLDDNGVLVVRLVGLPAMLLAPVAGWLVGRRGAIRVAIAGYLLAAIGLAAEGIAVAVPWALVIASVIFVLGIATIVPATIALVGGRGGSSRAGALALSGLYVFAGASCGPLIAQLPIGFTGLMLTLAAMLMIAAGLVGISGRRTIDISV